MTTDPFATREQTPSISFKDQPIGTTYSGRVVEAPQEVQSRDFDTGEPATWPGGNPKKSVVTILEIIGGPLNGEKRGLWAPRPSAMFRAIADAQQAAGAQIAVGGILTVTFVGEQPNEKNPRLNPQKLYKVVYQPNDPFAGAPDWAQPNGQEAQQVNYQTGEVAQQPAAPVSTYNVQAASQRQPAWGQQPTTHSQPAQPGLIQGQPDAATLAALKAANLTPDAIRAIYPAYAG